MNALWLALHFHRLPLEVFVLPAEQPAATVSQHRVLSCNAAAEALGVAPGMRLSGALGLAPGLAVQERAPEREAATLHQLACWAGSFSPHVSLAGGDCLLVEVGGCLRLFDGLAALRERIQAEVVAQGFSLHLGQAPTPLAAHWLALAGGEGACMAVDELRACLDDLPLTVLELNATEQRTLAALGVRRMRELFALPAAGLARRFGLGLPQQLAQALGEAPDLREPFVFPESFVQKLELPAKVAQADMLLFAARRMLASLAGWLAARLAGVAECTLLLMHEDIPPTRLVLAFASPTRELARMERVLRERLALCALPAAVTDLALEAQDVQQVAGSTPGLFAQQAAHALEPVIERLRARLGQEAVHGLAVHADHRPENATRWLPRGQGGAPHAAIAPRPFWLLPQAQALVEREGRVEHHGAPLQRIAGPERIESGWWDGVADAPEADFHDLRRDYYIAVSEAGAWLWIFRDARGWWLHGVFA